MEGNLDLDEEKSDRHKSSYPKDRLINLEKVSNRELVSLYDLFYKKGFGSEDHRQHAEAVVKQIVRKIEEDVGHKTALFFRKRGSIHGKSKPITNAINEKLRLSDLNL